MAFNRSDFGKLSKSPVIRPIFTVDSNVDGKPTPPLNNLMLTEDGNFMVTESGAYMMVE